MKRKNGNFQFETFLGIISLVVSVAVLLSKTDTATVLLVATIGVVIILLIQIYLVFKQID